MRFNSFHKMAWGYIRTQVDNLEAAALQHESKQIFPDIAEVGFPYAIVNNRYVHELMLYLESGL